VGGIRFGLGHGREPPFEELGVVRRPGGVVRASGFKLFLISDRSAEKLFAQGYPLVEFAFDGGSWGGE
jgi:hypothetical protein